MKLKKYYFDCYIKESDEIIIGYSATLKIGVLTIPYSYIMHKKKGETLYQKQSFSTGEVISEENPENGNISSICWKNSKLEVEGTWKKGNDTGIQKLFSSEAGKIDWHCVNNGADVHIKWDGNEYSGKGYAEYVDVTLPLWKLPFTDLKWGRWVSEEGNEGITWISWKDRKNNGNRLSRIWDSNATGCNVAEGEVSYTENDIILGNKKIEAVERKEIRNEIVSRSILGNKSIFSLLLPKGLRNIDEKKYYSRGILEGKEGNIIFEEVFWK